MSGTLLAILGFIFASNGFWNFVTLRMQKKESKEDNLTKGVVALLHDSLYGKATHYLAVGEISLEEMDNLKVVYTAYNALGGNGTGTELYSRCTKLHLTEVYDEREELHKQTDRDHKEARP